MRRQPLAILIASTSDGLDANHLPLLLDSSAGPLGTLRGHLARANPLWRQVTEGAEVLCVFRGADRYISPSWYPSKQQHGRVVPTWDYLVAHAHGPIRWHEDREWLRSVVQLLTYEHEGAREKPWRVSDAPADYIDRMLNAIVGFEIPIARLSGKWKASQNQPSADRESVARMLSEEGTAAASELADAVRRLD
jgi:transcriptional regulator